MLGKKKREAEPFRVPTLGEADETYCSLLTRRAELHAAYGDAQRQRAEAEQELAADKTTEIRPGVAELLGDGPSAKALKRQRAAEARQRAADVEAALSVIEQRLRDAKTGAVRKAVALVRPEFDRRMQSMCDAMKALDAAHRNFDDLCQGLEVEGIDPSYLGPRPYFLGSARESDRRIASFLKEAGNA